MELSEQDLAAFREVFDLVDKDGSGAIDAREVSELMSLIGMKTSPEEVDLLVSEIDADGNGEVDSRSFCSSSRGGIRTTGSRVGSSCSRSPCSRTNAYPLV